MLQPILVVALEDAVDNMCYY